MYMPMLCFPAVANSYLCIFLSFKRLKKIKSEKKVKIKKKLKKIQIKVVVLADSIGDKSVEKQHVLVCTAHIHWDPEFCDVKLIQVLPPSN